MALHSDKIFSQKLCLLNRYLGNLRMSSRVFFLCLKRNITDSKHVVISWYFVIAVDSYPPVSCKTFRIKPYRTVSRNTCSPDNHSGADTFTWINKYSFFITSGCPCICKNLHSHFFQETPGFIWRFLSHRA